MVHIGKHMYTAACPDCVGRLVKVTNETDRDIVEDCRNPNASRRCLHEENTSGPASIGISADFGNGDLHLGNDRIIHAWQIYAGRYDAKTIDRHLTAIRYFEDILEGKPFGRLTRDEVAKVREDFKRRAIVGVPDSLSSSSIRHRISHSCAFLGWLRKQDAGRSLPPDLEDYLQLPKAVLAAAAQVRQKDYPTLSEAEVLLVAMPSKSLVERRAKAIFAIAFLGALRADTLVSLKVKHVHISRCLIMQDARALRAKAGKSINIAWFPISKSFEAAVVTWIEILERLGISGEDALFPDAIWLKARPKLSRHEPKPVPVMSTIHAVTDAFAIACRECEVKYTPHSAKHCIGAERDKRALTHLERKAWSVNMGHESEKITERHYGKMPDEQRFNVLEHIGESVNGIEREISDEEKIAIVNGVLELVRGR